jgi:hypothetical protein
LKGQTEMEQQLGEFYFQARAGSDTFTQLGLLQLTSTQSFPASDHGADVSVEEYTLHCQ